MTDNVDELIGLASNNNAPYFVFLLSMCKFYQIFLSSRVIKFKMASLFSPSSAMWNWRMFVMALVRLHYIALHHITSHYFTIHHITLHYITLHHITSHYITLYYITLHHITSHYITLYYITLHYITLHYITLHYIRTIGGCLVHRLREGVPSYALLNFTSKPDSLQSVWAIYHSTPFLSHSLPPPPLQ